MGSSAIGLLTYADTTAYAEASPTKGFEFAAAGLPMVASPNRMNAAVLARSGAGFVSADFGSQALSTAIVEALSDRSSWNAASAAGRVWAAQEGSWAGSEQRLLQLYSTVLGDLPGRGTNTVK